MTYVCLFSYYGKGQYWPERIQAVRDESLYEFLENSLHLLPLEPRHATFKVLEKTKINEEGAKKLAEAADGCWKAISKKQREREERHRQRGKETETKRQRDKETSR